MFDPSLLGLTTVEKRPRDDNPQTTPKRVATQIPTADESIPSSLPVFALPVGFSFQQSSPTPTNHDRRTGRWFANAGLMREDGGVRGFLETSRKIDK